MYVTIAHGFVVFLRPSDFYFQISQSERINEIQCVRNMTFSLNLCTIGIEKI